MANITNMMELDGFTSRKADTMDRFPQLDIMLDRGSSVPLYHQIRNMIHAKIQEGSLTPGELLPPERKLAAKLGVNRTTVLNAYQDLKAEGLLISIVGKGTLVAQSHGQAEASANSPSFSWPTVMAQLSKQAQSPLIRQLLQKPAQPGAISFTVGNPPPECIPYEAISRIQQEIVMEMGSELFQHGPTDGYFPLRQSIADLCRSRGITAAAEEEIMVLSGAQQGLDVLSRVFIEQGDYVFIEEPSYFSAMQVFQQYGARLMTMPTDERGRLQLDLLETMLIRYRPKMIYVLPTSQNPSGRTMPLEERKGLLALAEKYQTFILEEDPYYELQYEEKPPPVPIKGLDRGQHVIYIGTFSKLLYPGMRVGWIVAPLQAIPALVQAKQTMDLHTNQWAQVVTDRICRSGQLRQSVRLAIETYQAKRNRMAHALYAYGHRDVSFELPAGGYFMWVKLPDAVNAMELLMRAEEKAVTFVPGDHFFAGKALGSYMRLNFTAPTLHQIEEGVERLGKLIHAAVKRNGSSLTKAGYYESRPLV